MEINDDGWNEREDEREGEKGKKTRKGRKQGSNKRCKQVNIVDGKTDYKQEIIKRRAEEERNDKRRQEKRTRR